MAGFGFHSPEPPQSYSRWPSTVSGMRSARRLTRRRALQALAGAATTGVTGCIKVDTSINDPPYGPNETARYRLGAQTSGWMGLEPPIIDQLRNPSFEFAPGQRVEITWVNLDGERHQFLVADSAGEVLAKTAPAATEGATRTLTFEARQEMVEYYCEFYPAQMRGTFLVTPQ